MSDGLEELNERYGLPSRLTFAPGPGGLTVARIAGDLATASVALHGGHVLAFQPRGAQPVLWVSRESRYAPGQAIRGGIPVCWPWFATHPTDAAKPSHGFARTSAWTVRSSEALPDGATRLRLGLGDSEATRALWPRAFELELAVTVGAALDVELLARNPGAAAFTWTGALHSYFRVSDAGAAAIRGLERCAYLDKVASYERREQHGPVRLTSETDRIYVDTEGDCLIDDPGWRRTIRVAKRGSRTTVVWNPWVEKARQASDFGVDAYREMVCVETACAADDVITMEPGGRHRLATTISVEPA